MLIDETINLDDETTTVVFRLTHKELRPLRYHIPTATWVGGIAGDRVICDRARALELIAHHRWTQAKQDQIGLRWRCTPFRLAAVDRALARCGLSIVDLPVVSRHVNKCNVVDEHDGLPTQWIEYSDGRATRVG